MHKFIERASWSVMATFSDGYIGAFRDCNPELWPHCHARTVALYAKDALSCSFDMAETWNRFPGGFCEFLDMLEAAKIKAEEEGNGSFIDRIAVSMANEVLTAEGIGGK